jgi:hypothetical protein
VNERCLRTATGELSLDKPFDLIEGHPATRRSYTALPS